MFIRWHPRHGTCFAERRRYAAKTTQPNLKWYRMNLALPPQVPVSRKRLGWELFAYVALAYGFTWAVHGSLVLLHIPFSLAFGTPSMLIYKLGLLGPLLGAILVTAWCRSRRDVTALLKRGVQWRFPFRWYVVAIGTVPALYLVDLVLFHDRAPAGFTFFSLPWVPILGQAWVVCAEEFGWRGFALPRLQALLGPLGGSLALGVIWASWHVPMFFVPGSPQHGEHILADFGSYLYGMICLTTIMVLLYNRSGGSVLVGMLFHASMNIAAFTIHIPASADWTNVLLGGMAIIAALCLPRPWFGRQAQVPGWQKVPGTI